MRLATICFYYLYQQVENSGGANWAIQVSFFMKNGKQGSVKRFRKTASGSALIVAVSEREQGYPALYAAHAARWNPDMDGPIQPQASDVS